MSKIIKLYEDVNQEKMYDEYYCANIIEKLFECNQILMYKKGGGYGFNYRYCSKCYKRWEEMKNPIKNNKKCLIDIKKLNF